MNNYFELIKLCSEIQYLVGWKIIESFSQEKNVLLIRLFAGTEERYLQFSTDSKLNSLFVRNIFHRAKSNTANVFCEIEGQNIKNIFLVKQERELVFVLNDYELHFYFFGGSKSNVLLMQKSGIVSDSFKNSYRLKGTQGNKQEAVVFNGSSDVQDIELLKKQLGKKYLPEFENMADNDMEEREKISLFAHSLLSTDKCYILFREHNNNATEPVFSLIKLKDYPEVYREFNTMNEGMAAYYSFMMGSARFFGLKNRALSMLQKKIERISKKLAAFGNNDENLKRAEKYELWGNLLSSRSDLKSRAGKEISLSDWYGNAHLIPLKAEKTLLENSIRYFEKSKSIYREISRNKAIEPQLRINLASIKKLFETITICDNLKQLEKIMKENSENFESNNSRDKSVDSKYRRFELGENYVLYVGKNAANNDELTMKFAKANDLWFHARGTSGSHAVLKSPNTERPPKQIIQKAASIAAYYSGARNAGYIPVAYTYKKYIHKPKGANPGAVVLSREEVIMVKPGLPETNISDAF